MKSIKESQLAAYIDSYISRNYNIKKTIERHFQGTITSVKQIKTNGPYLVKINRTEGSDGNDYICAVPGYVPSVGDIVECEWREIGIGQVKFPLNSRDVVADAHLLATGQSPSVIGLVGMTSGPFLDSGSTDFAGRIEFTPTSTLGAGTALLSLIFATPFANRPFCVANSSRGQSSGSDIEAYFGGSDNTKQQFYVGSSNLIGGTQYSIDYIIVGWK